MKDTDFYNKESETYSEKRYPKVPTSYTQFFFKKRLKIVFRLLEKNLKDTEELSFLDIGCADGFVLNEIHNHFPKLFSEMIGIDTSPKMIEVSKKKYSNETFVFKVREDFSDISPKDVIVEVGVINYADLNIELDFASRHLKDDAIYIISLAGTNSLWNRIKKGDKGFRNFLSYREYEKEINKNFEIVRVVPVGLFIPLIWKLPTLARFIQSLETIFCPFTNIFHEKVYLLKKK